MAEGTSTPQNSRDLIKGALVRIQELESELALIQAQKNEPIAIVGMGCRLPGDAINPKTLWDLLAKGRSGICEVPAERWDINALYDPDLTVPGKMNTRYGGFVKHVADFDPEFFGISPREAASMDPQQRLLLEVTWEALENSNIDPRELYGKAAGVFIGIIAYDYGQRLLALNGLQNIDAYSGTGSSLGVAAGRLSYILGLTGPSLSLDTACSSSLVTIHLACESLRRRECDLAITGGVNLMLEPGLSVNFSKAHMLSADGQCKTFDSSADGYVRGEGCGIVILKRLSDAIKDQDPILALIRGSAVNQDGASGGLTVPSGPSQSAVIRQALHNAGLSPSDVSYIEAHGTGTSLGDPIELGSMSEVFSEQRALNDPLWIGSIKTNIGHLEAAAGIAGIMKLVLALEHEQLPPHLNCQTPTPRFPWKDKPLRVVQATQPWPRSSKPRIAGVSSFGFSGTNAHILLEEAPLDTRDLKSHPAAKRVSTQILNLSARSEPALRELANSYSSLLLNHSDINLYQLCANAAASRANLKYRLSVLGSTSLEITERLNEFVRAETNRAIVHAPEHSTSNTDTAFLFTGQGSQYPGMGQALYATYPEFKKWIDLCAKILSQHCDKPLTELLFQTESASLNQSLYTQPALFCLEYAVAKLWQSFGVHPTILVGHSLGEYVAACLAGVFSLEDAIGIVSKRASLMQALPKNGAMAAVSLSEKDLATHLQAYQTDVAIAAINGKERCVISGNKDSVDLVLKALDQQQVAYSMLSVSHAFHSPLMEPMLASFKEYLNTVTFNPARIPIISNLTGELANQDICTQDYWLKHIREPVQFAKAVELLKTKNIECCIEVGPSPILCSLARETLSGAALLPSLKQHEADNWHILHALGKLHTRHQLVDWQQTYPRSTFSHLALPNYPFQRERYWVERRPEHAQPTRPDKHNHPLLGAPLKLPGLPEQQTRFSTLLDTELSYLTEHCVFGQAILPATGLIEIALAAYMQQGGSLPVTLSNFEISQAFTISGQIDHDSQIILNQNPEGYQFDLYSNAQSSERVSDQWTLNARGQISPSVRTASTDKTLAQLRKRLTGELTVTDFYQHCEALGIHYGPSYRLLKHLWKFDQQALADITLSDNELVGQFDQYYCYPTLLDACFQILFSVLPSQTADEICLPFSIDSLTLYQPLEPNIVCHVELVSSPEGRVQVADVTVFNQSGQILCQVSSLKATKVAAASWQKTVATSNQISQLLYDIDWQLSPLPQAIPASATSNKPDIWLIFSDDAGLGSCIQGSCDAAQIGHISVHKGEHFAQLSPTQFSINPFAAQDYLKLFEQLSGRVISRCVYLWSLELPIQIAPTTSLTEQIGLAWKAPLHLVQALQQQTVSDRLLLDFVTRGACALTSNSQPTFQAAPLFGLVKSLQAEVSNFSCRVIDLEQNIAGVDHAAEASLLFLDAVQAAEQPVEDQLAYRNSLRYAPRLKRLAPPKPFPATPSYQLTIPASGSLGDLAWQACERAEPQPGEVEIEVHATGLNFKDVLLALHRVPAMGDGLGVECAGRVVKLGSGVTEFALGERVLAMVPGSLSRFICAPVATTVSLPAAIEDRAAATIPITFLTAAYALESLAHLQPGERVLIHAATGGVGQAAIQIAQAAGAVVFATASQGKWQILKDLGVEHIFDSRTTEFEAAIQALTHGEGLDVVLNSLRGEFTDASLRLLRAGGRFLEIGITDLRTPEQIAQFSTAIQYFPIDLMVLYREQRHVLQTLLRRLLERFATDELKPLPYQTFAAEAIETAFRTMQQAKHTGKVIIDMQQQAVISNDPNDQYLILGGLGDLGLSLANWLVEQRAQHICLVARSTPTPDKQAQLDTLREAGSTITVLQADITAPNDVARFVRQLKDSGQRLRGIFHCASVLDDGVLSQQSVERFDKVLRSKIDSAWLVHQQTLDLPLDFFVLFSSATALLGAPGQTNYAAANAFLDSFAQYRRATGRAALAINWGAWAEIGLAARMSSPLNLAKQGIRAMPPRLALAALSHAMHHHGAQLGVFDIDWRTYQLNKKSQAFLAAFQDDAASQARPTSTSSLLNDVATANTEERAALILQLVEQNIVAVLSLPKSRSIDRKQGFLDMGMDSLTAVELKNRLNRELMVPLPATLAFDYPNTTSLANYLVSKINEKFPLVEAKMKDSRDADTLAIEQLSEQEAAEELRKTLKDMGFGD